MIVCLMILYIILIILRRLPSHGNILRVGFSDFRADPMDRCQIFTSTADSATGPHMMFETVPLDEGAFALKNIGTDLLVQVRIRTERKKRVYLKKLKNSAYTFGLI